MLLQVRSLLLIASSTFISAGADKRTLQLFTNVPPPALSIFTGGNSFSSTVVIRSALPDFFSVDKSLFCTDRHPLLSLMAELSVMLNTVNADSSVSSSGPTEILSSLSLSDSRALKMTSFIGPALYGLLASVFEGKFSGSARMVGLPDWMPRTPAGNNSESSGFWEVYPDRLQSFTGFASGLESKQGEKTEEGKGC